MYQQWKSPTIPSQNNTTLLLMILRTERSITGRSMTPKGQAPDFNVSSWYGNKYDRHTSSSEIVSGNGTD
jgi:hypothetical protein